MANLYKTQKQTDYSWLKQSIDIVNFMLENDIELEHPLPRFLKGYSPIEIEKYTFLRAIEWRSWPAFLGVSLALPFFFLFNPALVIVGAAVLNFFWSLFLPTWTSLTLANIGVFINKLKFIVCPILIVVAVISSNYLLAILLLSWTVYLGNIIGTIRIKRELNQIQNRFLMNIYKIK